MLGLTDISQASQLFQSSLTAVDLGEVRTIELDFDSVCIPEAKGLTQRLGQNERARTDPIFLSLGASQ